MKQVAWKNTTNTNNIPAELTPLVSTIVDIYQNYYGDALHAVFINGSVVRGEWKPGSDIDVIGFVHGDAYPDDPKLAALLTAALKGTELPVSNIDPFTITDIMQTDASPRTKYRMMILALDGLQVWGDALDVSTWVPADPIAFASRLYFDFKSGYERYSQMEYDDSKDMVRRGKRIPKMILRLANGIAVINGAPFSSSYETALKYIKQFAPKYYDDAQRCYRLRREPRLDSVNYADICRILGELVVKAESLGVTFAEIKETGKNT